MDGRSGGGGPPRRRWMQLNGLSQAKDIWKRAVTTIMGAIRMPRNRQQNSNTTALPEPLRQLASYSTSIMSVMRSNIVRRTQQASQNQSQVDSQSQVHLSQGHQAVTTYQNVAPAHCTCFPANFPDNIPTKNPKISCTIIKHAIATLPVIIEEHTYKQKFPSKKEYSNSNCEENKRKPDNANRNNKNICNLLSAAAYLEQNERSRLKPQPYLPEVQKFESPQSVTSDSSLESSGTYDSHNFYKRNFYKVTSYDSEINSIHSTVGSSANTSNIEFTDNWLTESIPVFAASQSMVNIPLNDKQGTSAAATDVSWAIQEKENYHSLPSLFYRTDSSSTLSSNELQSVMLPLPLLQSKMLDREVTLDKDTPKNNCSDLYDPGEGTSGQQNVIDYDSSDSDSLNIVWNEKKEETERRLLSPVPFSPRPDYSPIDFQYLLLPHDVICPTPISPNTVAKASSPKDSEDN